jgi:signal transduction histidine kinase/CheY-like chemotaxis protein
MTGNSIDFLVRSVFFGGIFTTSVNCFVSYFSRGREKISLSYGLFTFFVSSFFFIRRIVLDLGLVPHAYFLPLTVVGMLLSHCAVASALHFFLTFFDLRRSSPVFRFLAGYLIVLTFLLIGVLVQMIARRGSWLFLLYLILLGVYVVCALGCVVFLLRGRRPRFPPNKRILVFLIALFLHIFILIALNVIGAVPPYAFVIASLYVTLIAFFYIQGSKVSGDFKELVALKADLEKEVAERTVRIEDLLKRSTGLFAILTHDLKNLLMLISLTLEHYMESAPAHRDLELIKGNIQKLQHDMRHYMEFTDSSGTQFRFDHSQATDLSWLLHEKVAIYRPSAAKKSIELRVKSGSSLVLFADPVALDKILSNLIDNAIKYSQPGGRVEAVLARRGRTARLVVRDAGRGISKTALPRVFDLGYRGDDEKAGAPGSGLGLWIVRKIVGDLGGVISIRSRPSKNGFYALGRPWVTEVALVFRLPRSPVLKAVDSVEAFSPARPAESAPPDAVVESASDAAAAAILVVEDDPGLLQALCEGLGSEYKVSGARNGADALRKIEAMSGKPDIVITDIVMDVMDGYELIRRLKEMPAYRNLPVIFLTGINSPDDRL